MIVAMVMDEIVHLDQTTRMIGIGVIVDTLHVAIRTGMTIDPEVEHAVLRLGGKRRGIIDVVTIAPGAGEMIVETDIIEVNESRRNMTIAYPHHETTIAPAMIDPHHHHETTTGPEHHFHLIITKRNQTSPGHQQWTWPLVPLPLALHLHLVHHLQQVAMQWTKSAQLD
jgi:hypothetical protein